MDTSSAYLLRTARLGMRRWKDSDLEVFVAMNRDPEVMEFFPRIWTAEESYPLRGDRMAAAARGVGVWVCDGGGEGMSASWV